MTSRIAPAIAEAFLKTTRDQGVITQSQVLDKNTFRRLTATLNQPVYTMNTRAKVLPPGWHLAWFTPYQPADELGRDGTDTTFNPPEPFTRRMWAGGEIEWQPRARLTISSKVKETTELVSAEPKVTRTGEEMIVVQVEKTYGSPGLILRDRRDWIFRPQITTPTPPKERPEAVPFPPPSKEEPDARDICQTPVSLFQFSALTFNAHKIHYNKEWCREVEGHRDLVVHGPLNLIHILDFWRDVCGGGHPNKCPKKIIYKATSPLYVGETYRILMGEPNDEKVVDEIIRRVRIVNESGDIAMTATIYEYTPDYLSRNPKDKVGITGEGLD